MQYKKVSGLKDFSGFGYFNNSNPVTIWGHQQVKLSGAALHCAQVNCASLLALTASTYDCQLCPQVINYISVEQPVQTWLDFACDVVGRSMEGNLGQIDQPLNQP